VRSDFDTLTIGIPRVLNVYENFPFWYALLTECKINVVLSDKSTTDLYEKGMGTVMSDNICFPAKLVHGHIFNLAEKKVDRILLPMVFMEKASAPSHNTFNCPIVTGYAEVIKSAINPKKRWDIALDAFPVTFHDENLLKQACWEYIASLKKSGFEVSAMQFERAFDKAVEAQRDFKKRLKAKADEIMQQDKPLFVVAGRPYHTDPLVNQQTAEILTELGANVISEDVLPAVTDGLHDFYLSQWGYPARITNAAKWVAAQGDNVRLVQLNSFGCGPDAIITDEVKEILQSKGKNNNLIRVDEITSTGSIRLRLRSVVEFAKYSNRDILRRAEKQRKETKVFMPEDRHRTIIAPLFSDIYSQLVPMYFRLFGYNLVTLPVTDKDAIEVGLRYANNEICYPAITVIGDIIKALQSGKYNPDEVAVGMTQTGGQCRASNYLPLIKKALANAGFENVPIVSIAVNTGLHEQPGFEIPWAKIMRKFLASVIFSDELSKMHYSTVFREINKGDSRKLLDAFMLKLDGIVRNKGKVSDIFKLLAEAAAAYNQVPIKEGQFAKIGLVGEIYLKYNAFANLNIVEWLNNQEVEVIVPSLLDFFIQDVVNVKINARARIDTQTFKGKFIIWLIRKALKSYMHRAERAAQQFRFYRPHHSIDEVAQGASKIISLTHQYGEGWLIPGEISTFAKIGVNHVVSLQPFGCIANQVISKGVEKRMRDKYPHLNLLFLDFDAGTSEVNIFNRLYFMVKAAKEEVKDKT
jgi:predicted nucleotide-binding protein (sugar kinase/HSP70/actin superfamily)